MKTLVVGSLNENAGKTSLIAGLSKVVKGKCSYLKPFGDRLVYRHKKLWDYDSALLTGILGLEPGSVDMTLGFDHSRLRYLYNEDSVKAKLLETISGLQKDTQLLFVEGCKNLSYGASINLDTLSLVRFTGGRLVLVVGGDADSVVDDIIFIKKYLNLANIDYGIIINKVYNLPEFRNAYLKAITNMGVKVLGIMPYEAALTRVSVRYIAELLQANIIAGAGNLDRKVDNVMVGAASGDSAMRLPLFRDSTSRLVITVGDRADMIVASLDRSTAGIVLTNDILPPQNLIAKAATLNIPLLLVSFDTFHAAKRIDQTVPLLAKDDTERLEQLHQMVEQHVDINAVMA